LQKPKSSKKFYRVFNDNYERRSKNDHLTRVHMCYSTELSNAGAQQPPAETISRPARGIRLQQKSRWKPRYSAKKNQKRTPFHKIIDTEHNGEGIGSSSVL